uniref:Transposase n=1 Tax=Streptomyces sp. NBC_00008 TaxID=2903610 RepID=A0AAU2VGY1_9ACTN
MRNPPHPHDTCPQTWTHPPDSELPDTLGIYRDHVHRLFGEPAWQHIRSLALHGSHDDDRSLKPTSPTASTNSYTASATP